MTKDEIIDKLWETSGHGTERADIVAAYEAGENAKRSGLEEYIQMRLKVVEEANEELRKYLKVAIDEADAWCDDGRGNPVPEGENPEFDYARTLIKKS